MPFIEQLGQAVGGGILGIGLGAINDERQYNQQQRLQELQIKGSKEMTDYQRQSQMQMWNDTNYGAQMEHLKKAGLNPGLIYGMKGGGGTTTGAGAASVGGGNAAGHSGEAMGMGLASAQMGLLAAQKANIEADTENKKATTPKIGAETAATQQGIMNAKAQEILLKGQKQLQDIAINIAADTYEQTVNQVTANLRATEAAAAKANQERTVSEGTMQSVIAQAKAEAIGAVIKNALMRAQIEETNASADVARANIEKIGSEIDKWATEIQQNWTRLSQEERKTQMTERMTKFNTSQSQRTYDNIIKGVNSVSGAVGSAKGAPTINQTGARETVIHNY